jgi:hypothetical protein
MESIGDYRKGPAENPYDSLEYTKENIARKAEPHCPVGTFPAFFVDFYFHVPRSGLNCHYTLPFLIL